MSNITNTTGFSIDSIILRMGFTLWISADNIIFVLVPNSLAMISEAVCFFVFCRINNNAPLFVYLRAYTINNFLVSSCFFFQFFYASYHLGDPRIKALFNGYFVIAFLGICYVNSTLLDIVILLDRISTFNKRVKDLTKLISPFKQIALLALISIAFTTPYFFLYSPVKRAYTGPDGTVYTVWLSSTSTLVNTNTGFALVILILTTDYILVMMAQITLNVCSMFYIRKHLKEKKAIVGTTMTRSNNYQNVDLKMSLMVTILCVVSFAEHLLLVSSYIGLFFFKYTFNLVLLQKITFLSFGIRRFTDVLFYFIFNKVFKKQALTSMGLVKDARVGSAGRVVPNNRSGK